MDNTMDWLIGLVFKTIALAKEKQFTPWETGIAIVCIVIGALVVMYLKYKNRREKNRNTTNKKPKKNDAVRRSQIQGGKSTSNAVGINAKLQNKSKVKFGNVKVRRSGKGSGNVTGADVHTKDEGELEVGDINVNDDRRYTKHEEKKKKI